MANKKEEISNEIARKLVNMLYIVIILLVVNLAIGISNVTRTNDFIDKNSTTDKNKDKNNDSDTIPEYDVSKYKAINYSEFSKAKKAKGYQVIYIGRSSCGYCAKFIPIMNQVQSDYGFTHLYFDITQLFDFAKNKVTDENAYNELIKENDFYKENLLSTPMVVVYKDGKYVSGTVGYQQVETYANFIEDAGMKKN